MTLIDRIKWDAPSDSAIVWKYKSDAIRIGAQLIVNESQEAIFFKGGKALDTFGPGTHTLSSGNLPMLGTLIGLPFGGETPFSAEVWFINKTAKRDLKWGTKSSIQVVDPVYKYPVSVAAFGRWGMRISNAKSFLLQLIGTQGSSPSQEYINSDRVEEYFIGEIVQRLSDALAKFFVEQKIPVFEANAHLNDLSKSVANNISPELERFGIEVVNFNVERISISDDDTKKLQEVLLRRVEIEQISQAEVGPAYSTMRTFDVLEKSAENEGGLSGQLLSGGLGLGVGLSAGLPLGKKLGRAMDVEPQQQKGDDQVAKLQKLRQLLDANLITEEEFNAQKRKVLDSL